MFGHSMFGVFEVRYFGVRSKTSIGRVIGKADMGNAYRYRLSVSADKKAHIGSLADIMK